MTGPTTKVPNDLRSFTSLVKIVSSLRGPDGCPWDNQQTHQSLTQYAVEETMELVEAIETQNDLLFKEELGDVLFQVILHSVLATERRAFSLEDIIEGIATKLIRRHPHVFSDQKVKDTQEVIENWATIKKLEKQGKEERVSFGLPPQLSALQKSYKIGLKTAKTKFDWNHPAEVLEKVEEEIQELKAELNKDNPSQKMTEEEFGDLLFSIAQLGRHLEIEPESALRKANLKFEDRYFKMIQLAQQKGLDFESISIEEKENLWKEIKRK